MEPEIPSPAPDPEPPQLPTPGLDREIQRAEPEKPYHGLKWIFIGPQGLRAGWSALIFLVLFVAFGSGFGFLFFRLHLVSRGAFTPSSAFFGELFQVLALVAAAAVVAVIERRSILDYNLRGPRRTVHFFSGILVGFAALSTLVGVLAWGGWLHFGSVTIHGSQIMKFALIWGAMFLLVGCMEEGLMRCFLLATLARGTNFWWAVGTIALVCATVLTWTKGNGNWGVYIIALLGLVPCWLLHLNRAPSSGFWQASWITSTLFGAMHTGNNGEAWIGIFAAAFIGFVFCVSVWVTGSAWWAIGCHAAWDWAETYFYGTADSGMVAPGHLFSTSPTGNPLWSGGATGPEGSLLVIPIVLLILVWLIVIYRRPRSVELSTPAATEQLAG